MKNPWVRLCGGMVIGGFLVLPFYMAGALIPDQKLSWVNEMPPDLGSIESLLGFMLGLIALILVGFGTGWRQHFQQETVKLSCGESYRQGRIYRVTRGRPRRFH